MSRGVRAPASARSWSPNAASGPDQGVLRQAARDPPRQGPPNADARNRAGRPSARARHADGHTSRPPTPRTLSRATQAEGEPAHRVPTQASNASPVPRETGARVAREVPTPAPTAHRCAPHSRAPPHGVTSVTGLAGDSSACALAIGPAGQHAPDSASASARRRPAPSPRLSASLQPWSSTLCSRRGDSHRATPSASSSGTVAALASPGADSPGAVSLARLPYADSLRRLLGVTLRADDHPSGPGTAHGRRSFSTRASRAARASRCRLSRSDRGPILIAARNTHH